MKIDTFLTSYKPPEVLSKYYPYGCLCHDKEGNVVSYADVGNVDIKGFWNSAKPVDGLKTILLFMQQDLMQLELQNKKLGTNLTKVGYIYNLENLSFVDALHKESFELLLGYYKIYLDNYPERMKYVYIINAKPYVNFAISIFKPIFSSAVLEKLKFYGSSGWKEDLLKIIDADELPAFLGGNKTDPDGNPLCKTFVKHGQQIPESYYLNYRKKLLSCSSHLKKLTVQRSSMEEMRFKITESLSLLEWEFELKNRDIDFAVYFNSSEEESELVEIVPKQRMDTYYGPEKNYVKCENRGIYTIVFDNSYSWVHSKEVFYRIRVRKPNE
ncbi:retinal-binding protein [Trichonephila inaurata madagascariensis]|uniref:Retinal-binding protein n=1 Tax=Trichonephila inaurata madagascariensis TaxID=2747483 RepID=A0A8X6YWB3_9ARAC|nr:retinal-binding protein [Trichonephila inaurata madagascariensis]